MDRGIVSIMQQACIFAVIAQMIFYFRPNETYEKYLKLLIGMILIAVLFVPILNLFHLISADDFQIAISDYEENIQEVYQKMYQGEVDFKELSNQIEGNQNQFQEVENEVKTRINNLKNMKYIVESVKITGVTYLDGKNDLTDMRLEINMKKKRSDLIDIEIESVNIKESEGNQESEKERIKDLIVETLGIERERMVINLNE